MGKKKEDDLQYELDFSSRTHSVSAVHERTEADLPDLSASMPSHAREDFENSAASMGVSARVLKYAIDVYSDNFSLFIEAYVLSQSLDVADALMRLDEVETR